MKFKSKLHLACGTDDYRPALSYVSFKKGYAYATNAHIAIKQSLMLHELSDDEIKNLEGKAIHRRDFQEIMLAKYDFMVIHPDKIVLHPQKKYGSYTVEIKLQESEFKAPNIDGVLQPAIDRMKDAAMNPCFNIRFMEIARDLLIFEDNITSSVKLHSYAKDRGMILTTLRENKEKQFLMIMPVMEND